jgi:HEAT repeat protein
MLRAIWADPDSDAPEASLDALASRYADVRLDAWSRLVEHAPDVALDPFAELLVDAAPQVRRTAIRIAVDGQLTGASMALVRRTRDGAFNKLPLSERHAVLKALLELAPAEADEALGWLVVSEKAFTDADHDRTRQLAAELLGDLGGPGAIQHLKAVTGLRFWTAKAVKKAAREALEKIEARQAEGG